jgi:hypothetical protein
VMMIQFIITQRKVSTFLDFVNRVIFGTDDTVSKMVLFRSSGENGETPMFTLGVLKRLFSN